MSTAQKMIKYMAIVFAACLTISILAGILSAAVSICGSFVPDRSVNRNNRVTKQVESKIDGEDTFQDVQNLKIESSVYKVIIEQDSEVNGVKLTYMNIPSTFKVYYNKDTKTLETEDDNWASGLFRKNHESKKGTIHIYVQEGLSMDKTEINMGVGSVKIKDLSMDKLDVDCGVGEFTCNDITANDAKINGGVGNVICSGVNFGSLDLEGGVGDVDLEGMLTGKTKISAGMGNVKADINGKRDDYNVKVETGLGSIYIDDQKYSDTKSFNNSESNLLDIEGGVGNIHINFK